MYGRGLKNSSASLNVSLLFGLLQDCSTVTQIGSSSQLCTAVHKFHSLGLLHLQPLVLGWRRNSFVMSLSKSSSVSILPPSTLVISVLQASLPTRYSLEPSM